MKWLTIDYIKEHSRIDYSSEVAALDLYACAAEDTVLAVIRRTYNNVIDKYGTIPPAMYHAALMLTDVGYEHRNPVSQMNLSVIPYTFDMIIADLVRYDNATDLQAERNQLLSMLSDVKTNLDLGYSLIEEPTEEQTAAYDQLVEIIFNTVVKYSGIENPTSQVCDRLRSQYQTTKEEVEEFLSE